MKNNAQRPAVLLALLVATLFFSPVDSAVAAAKSDIAQLAFEKAQTCTLLTDDECTAHERKLEILTDTSERTRYLAEHIALIKERESACNCRLMQTAKTVTYPRVRQSMLNLGR